MKEIGFFTILYETLGQAFFTLSVGIGSMAIFGSYIDDKHSLAGESVRIIALDTFVAITAGIIIFPACFSYDVAPDQGPSLLFITLPNIFSQMKGGRIWASLFFLFMSFAALSTLIAVFENIISYWIDVKKMSRRKACLINYILILVLSLPCILGFNVLSSIQPFGEGSNILDLEDFIVSNIMLPLGCLLFVLFVTRKSGWGWDNFLQEAKALSSIFVSAFGKIIFFKFLFIKKAFMLIFFTVSGIFSSVFFIALGHITRAVFFLL